MFIRDETIECYCFYENFTKVSVFQEMINIFDQIFKKYVVKNVYKGI
jgi:hypothetical protein